MKGGNYSHYYKEVPYTHIDVYRVLDLFQVTDPCIQHAVKKLLVAGGRGHKNIDKDIREAIVSLERWQEMRKEDSNGLCEAYAPIENKQPVGYDAPTPSSKSLETAYDDVMF